MLLKKPLNYSEKMYRCLSHLSNAENSENVALLSQEYITFYSVANYLTALLFFCIFDPAKSASVSVRDLVVKFKMIIKHLTDSTIDQ